MASNAMVIHIKANVEDAQRRLAGLSDSIQVSTQRIQRLARSLEGNSLLQRAQEITAAVEQIGGVSKLTAAEKERLNATLTAAVEKYRVLGVEAPAALVALQRETTTQTTLIQRLQARLGPLGTALTAVFSVTAITGLIRHTMQFADQLTNLSAQTGISVVGLQKLNLAFQASGVSLETVSRSVVMLSRNIVGANNSTVEALKRLHLSVGELQQMAPEQQFLKVADAIGRIQHPTERAYAAVAIFGRTGGELLKGLTGNLEQTTSQFARMGLIVSEQAVRAADDFGDQLDVLKVKLMAVSLEAIGPMIPMIQTLASVLITVLGGALRGVTMIVYGLWAGITELLATLSDLALRVPIVGQHLGGLGRASTWLHEQAAKAARSIEQLALGTVDTARAAQAAGAPLLGFAEDTDRAGRAARRAADAYAQLMSEARNAQAMAQFELDAALHRAPTSEATRRIQSLALGAMPGVVRPSLDLVARSLDVEALMHGPGRVVSGQVTPSVSMAERLRAVQAQVLDSVRSVTGGSVTGFLSKIGSQLLGSLTGGLSHVMGAGLSAAVKGLGKLFGGLFGDKETKQVRELREQFVASAGGIAELQRQAQAAGISLDQLFSARKVRDYERAVADVQQRLRQWADEQAADAKRLEEAIRRYGFAFEELGPTLQQQRLHEQARELIEDWRVLVAAGIDVSTVNTRMAEAINTYLQTAIRVGAEIPAAMRPILQTLIDQRLLTDAAGNQLTDLEAAGIRFSETLTEGFDRVVAKLQEVIDAIRGAGSALASVPSAIDVAVNYVPGQWSAIAPREARHGAELELWEGPQIPMFHTGGWVGPGPGARAADEVLAMLQTGERVLSRAEVAALGGRFTDRDRRTDRTDQIVVELRGIREEQAALRAHLVRQAAVLPYLIRDEAIKARS